MSTLKSIAERFATGQIDKPTFIQTMYAEQHQRLFDYADYLARTNVKKIEIEDGRVITTSRDRGIRIVCGAGDHRIAPIETLNFLDYEKAESEMLENLVQDGDTFFDIGANIGWYSLNIAASRRATQVHCFEPLPKTWKQLQANLAINGFTNIQPHHFGFSNQAGSFPFYYYPEGSGNASGANLTGRTDVEVVECHVQTLDQYTADSGVRVDVIKCDVEGAELLVFQGGQATLARDKPIVFSEILRKWSAKFNYHPNAIFQLFGSLGYSAFSVGGGQLKPFASMDDATVETNFFFLHADKHADLIRRYQHS
jgi:FkbM family methyltransferase